MSSKDRFDAVNLYQRLPLDLQRVVKDYFYVWQRKGFRREPDVLAPRPELYFATIRRCPRGLKWCPRYPNMLFYRRHDHFFQWHLRVYSKTLIKDLWVIDATSQWGENKDEEIILENVFRSCAWSTLDPPSFSKHVEAYRDNHIITIEFTVERNGTTSTPSRQEMAERFASYIQELSVLFEKIRKRTR